MLTTTFLTGTARATPFEDFPPQPGWYPAPHTWEDDDGYTWVGYENCHLTEECEGSPWKGVAAVKRSGDDPGGPALWEEQLGGCILTLCKQETVTVPGPCALPPVPQVEPQPNGAIKVTYSYCTSLGSGGDTKYLLGPCLPPANARYEHDSQYGDDNVYYSYCTSEPAASGGDVVTVPGTIQVWTYCVERYDYPYVYTCG